jgi:hypothetical protein
VTTPSRSREEKRAAKGAAVAGPASPRAYIAARLRAEHARRRAAVPGACGFPDPYWWDHPEEFARRILGVAPTRAEDYPGAEDQVEVLEAVRDHSHTAFKGGRKVGKDFSVGILALAFFCAFPGARVRFTATTADQVDDIFWREVRILLAGHGRCVDCKRDNPDGPRPCPHSAVIEDEPGQLARTGLKSADFRELVGYTAREAEGIAGVSGLYQLNIADEASAIDDFYFEAIDGNMGGCVVGRLVLISNPTKLAGQFFRAFHEESGAWRTLTRSSRLTPNVVVGRIVVPGLATREWVEMMVAKYGEGSDFVTVHVDGDFPKRSTGTVFSVHAVVEATKRWAATKATGPLHLGIDVAGESGAGDEGAFSARRGYKALDVRTVRGLSADGYLIEALGMIARYGAPLVEGETRVIIDRGGEDGARVYRVFRAYLEEHWKAPPFVLVGLFASDKAVRDPLSYDKIRDELAANLADWIRQGGAIPEDTKLAVDLNQGFRWEERRIEDRNRLVDKLKIKKELGRSPDRADALALSAWGERLAPATATDPAENAPAIDPHEAPAERTFDPFSGMAAFRR